MADTTPQTIVVTDRGGPGFLVRIIWYLLVGWWLSGLAIVLAWLLAVTIIGLPLAFMLFNRIPAAPGRSAFRTEWLRAVTVCLRRSSELIAATLLMRQLRSPHIRLRGQ